MPELELWVLLVLTGMAFIAGLFSAIAGAGGMITLPLLLWAGLPPIAALGTNKVQSAVGTLSSALNFFRKGHIDLASMQSALFWGLVGSMFGVWCIRQLGDDMLQSILPGLLILAALYCLVSPQLSNEDRKQRISVPRFNRYVGGGMGFYGGFFGPGMATFLALSYASLLGYNARRATAHTKPLVLMVNGSAAGYFALAGDVNWGIALAMAAAQMIGARIGSNLVIDKGAAIVRPALILASLMLAIKLLMFR